MSQIFRESKRHRQKSKEAPRNCIRERAQGGLKWGDVIYPNS